MSAAGGTVATTGGPAGAVFEVYVYFRAEPARSAAVEAALGRQRALAASRCGLGMRSGCRLDPPGKPYLTWLGVYRPGRPPPADGADSLAALAPVLDEIERCAIDSGLAALAPEGRHREVFALAAPA